MNLSLMSIFPGLDLNRDMQDLLQIFPLVGIKRFEIDRSLTEGNFGAFCASFGLGLCFLGRARLLLFALGTARLRLDR